MEVSEVADLVTERLEAEHVGSMGTQLGDGLVSASLGSLPLSSRDDGHTLPFLNFVLLWHSSYTRLTVGGTHAGNTFLIYKTRESKSKLRPLLDAFVRDAAAAKANIGKLDKLDQNDYSGGRGR
jgi:hypothetical protein